MFMRKHTKTMTRVQKLALTALTALALTAGIAAANSSAELAGDPSQWGSVAKKGSFDITEFAVPEEQFASSDEGKHGDVPVVPGLARKVNEYEGQHRVA